MILGTDNRSVPLFYFRRLCRTTSVDSESGDSQSGWRVLANHDWTDSTALETSLCRVFHALEDVSDEVYLYECVDVEAVREAFGPGSERGVSEVRFEYEGYDVRVDDAGTIAVR